MLQITLSTRIATGLLCIFLVACGSGGAASQQQSSTSASSSTNGTPNASGEAPPVVARAPSTQPDTTPNNDGTSQSAAQADATRARFNQPLGLAVDVNDNVYVADSNNYTIRKITPAGVVTTLAGSPGSSGSADGTGAAARFMFLQGITVDSAGNVYVVDNSTIRKITSAGVVTTLAGTPGIRGHADGIGAAAHFNRPWGIAADADGNLYVADTENYLIRKVTPAGVVTTHAGTRGMRGNADGSTASATFFGPRGIAIDGTGNLYITDWLGPPAPSIPEGSTFIRKIAVDGAVSTLAGTLGSEFAPALFRDTFAIAADAKGQVYVAAFRSVRRVTPAGTISQRAEPDMRFASLEGIAIDTAGNLYVADTPNHAISKVTQDGTITLFAGKPGEAGSTDVPE